MSCERAILSPRLGRGIVATSRFGARSLPFSKEMRYWMRAVCVCVGLYPLSDQNNAAAEPKAADWISILSRYRDPSVVRSTFELIVTAVPFVALWLLIW